MAKMLLLLLMWRLLLLLLFLLSMLLLLLLLLLQLFSRCSGDYFLQLYVYCYSRRGMNPFRDATKWQKGGNELKKIS